LRQLGSGPHSNLGPTKRALLIVQKQVFMSRGQSPSPSVNSSNPMADDPQTALRALAQLDWEQLTQDQRRRLLMERRRLRELEIRRRMTPQQIAEETFRELMYSFHSFLAVFWPVALTMILTGLAVIYINDGTNGEGGDGLATLPTVVDESSTSGGGERATAALLNALLIVGIIAAATFVLVILYYFDCIRVLLAWLVLSTTLLLAFTTSYMVQVALFVYEVPFDSITFWIFFYNFAICGVLAIFYQKGIPMITTQGYLVCISVVMPWLLVRFLPEWTTWALLVLLALYDLCAVLTPCGPLNLLIGVAENKEHMLPGLLYEAQVNNRHLTGDARVAAFPVQGDSDSATSRSQRQNGNEAVGAAGVFAGMIFMASGDNEDQPPRPDKPRRIEGSSDVIPPLIQEPRRSQPIDPLHMQSESFADRNSIKLGLGDFVFYSVLCSRAALRGFSAFAAAFITIFAGLASTLFLLAVYQKALPALPISILLGVPLFFLTELLINPMTLSLVINYNSL